MSARPTLTTTAGASVASNQDALTVGPRGPVLLEDHLLIVKLAHQNRERVPERVVHAKGWGAHGTLTITEDVSRYSCAKVHPEMSPDRKAGRTPGRPDHGLATGQRREVWPWSGTTPNRPSHQREI